MDKRKRNRIKDNMYTVCVLKIMRHCKFTAIVQYYMYLLNILGLLLLLLNYAYSSTAYYSKNENVFCVLDKTILVKRRKLNFKCTKRE